jgi:hypothetical protein
MARINLEKIILFGVCLFILFAYFSFLKEGKTQTGGGSEVEVRGWAWIGANCSNVLNSTIEGEDANDCGADAKAIGWVSLNSENPEIFSLCSSKSGRESYSVKINTSTGKISGKAWIGIGENFQYTFCNTSNTVGYIDFDYSGDRSSCPSATCSPARVDGTEISGWAPIISNDFRKEGNNWIWTTNTPIAWVKFKGVSGGKEYKVRVDLTNGKLEGYAWSGIGKDGGLGWIKFFGTIPSGIITTTMPTPPGVPPDAFTLPSEPLKTFDIEIKEEDFSINTFLCKDKNFDSSFADKYSGTSIYPSTTYATPTYNRVASSSCPETQANRPVRFFVTSSCSGDCPAWKMRITLEPNKILPPSDFERIIIETKYVSGSLQIATSLIATVTSPYDYNVTACAFPEEKYLAYDKDSSNNCTNPRTLKVSHYICYFGFCAEAKKDPDNPDPLFGSLKYRIQRIFSDHDLPCRYYNNRICQAIIR